MSPFITALIHHSIFSNAAQPDDLKNTGTFNLSS